MNDKRPWWKPNEKFPCEYCGEVAYLDYYCGGCNECCGKQMASEILVSIPEIGVKDEG